MVKFLKSKQQQHLLRVPKCLAYFCDGENDFIALEDVRCHGYSHIQRQDVWKIEDINVILTGLAHFHAISLAYKTQFPSSFSCLVQNLEETYCSEKHYNWHNKYYVSLSYLKKKNQINFQTIFN